MISTKNTLTILFTFRKFISRRRKFQLFGSFLLMLLNGFTEVISFSLIIPFLTLLTDPYKFINNIYINQFFGFWNINNDPILIRTYISIIFALAVFVSAIIRVFNLWLANRLSAIIGNDISKKVYLQTITKTYEEHLNQNSSETISIITAYITAVSGAISLLLQMLSSVIISLSLIIGLLIIDSKLTFFIILFFLILYFITAFISSKILKRNSLFITKANEAQIKILQESIGAIREILLNNSQNIYMQSYNKADRPLRLLKSQNNFIAISPRFCIESIALILVIIFSTLVVNRSASAISIIPLLGAFALGAQKLLPAFQQIYSTYAGIKSQRIPIIKVSNVLGKLSLKNKHKKESLQFDFLSSIVFKNLYFKYLLGNSYSLIDINLTIKKGEKIGIIGETGSGKSTFLDILMGLLIPTKGNVYIDGKKLNDRNNTELIYSWRKLISHVPQDLYISDNSVYENIAFGVPRNFIDKEKVKIAAKKAQISNYIEKLTFGYDTLLGDRGSKLSGGQKQRIGIARAFYKDSAVIIFDEATSALDNKTQEKVIESINYVDEQITVVIVSHRLEAIENCDKIINLENGRIKSIIQKKEII